MKLYIIAFIGLSIIILLKLWQRNLESTKGEYEYNLNKSILTPAERSFYGVLKQAVGNDFDIFSKVRVADIFSPRKGYSKSAWQSAFNKISRKHFDFILSSKNDTSVKCCIELNDKSHNKSTRGLRDQFLQEICESTDLPFIQFATKSSYNIQTVKETIYEKLGINTNIKQLEG